MSSIYDICETTFTAYQTATAIPFGAVEFDPGTSPLPAKFFIYRVVSDPDVAFYDNKSKRRDYRIEVHLHTRTKDDLKTWPDLFDAAMITAGFRPQGTGRDIEKVETGHYGWSKDYKISIDRS